MVAFTRIAVSTGITFLTFFMEALLHYNIGKAGRITFRYFPGFKDLWKIAVVVGFFSVLSEAMTVVADRLLDRYYADE